MGEEDFAGDTGKYAFMLLCFIGEADPVCCVPGLYCLIPGTILFDTRTVLPCAGIVLCWSTVCVKFSFALGLSWVESFIDIKVRFLGQSLRIRAGEWPRSV